MGNTAQLLEKLDRALRREIEAYEQFLQLQHTEKSLAVEQKLEPFLANLQAKERLVCTISTLEKQRHAVSAHLARRLNFPDSPVTLGQLSARLGPPYAEKFLHYRSRLRALVTDLQRLNRENEILLRDSLTFIEGALAFFTRLLPENLTYHQSGIFPSSTQGRILSGRV